MVSRGGLIGSCVSCIIIIGVGNALVGLEDGCMSLYAILGNLKVFRSGSCVGIDLSSFDVGGILSVGGVNLIGIIGVGIIISVGVSTIGIVGVVCIIVVIGSVVDVDVEFDNNTGVVVVVVDIVVGVELSCRASINPSILLFSSLASCSALLKARSTLCHLGTASSSSTPIILFSARFLFLSSILSFLALSYPIATRCSTLNCASVSLRTFILSMVMAAYSAFLLINNVSSRDSAAIPSLSCVLVVLRVPSLPD